MDSFIAESASSSGTDSPKSLEEMVLSFWMDKQETDVEFMVQCGDGWINYTAHKLVLSLLSPKFADMFYSSDEKIDNAIIVTDVAPTPFETMLRFMYEGGTLLHKLKKDVRFILKVYNAATLYEVETLKQYCRNIFITSSPDKYNVFELLEAGKMMGSEILQEMCYKVLQTQTTKVLAARELHNVALPMMRTVLEMSVVSCQSEYELVMWAFAWVKNQFLMVSNERSFKSILHDILPYLKLTSLEAAEFGELVANHKSSDVFSDSDGFSIFMNIVKPGSWPLPEWYNVSDVTRTYSSLY